MEHLYNYRRIYTPVLSATLILILLLSPSASPAFAFGENTHTADFDGSQVWMIDDTDQVGLGITGDITISVWLKQASDVNGALVSKTCNFGGGDRRGYVLYDLDSFSDNFRFLVDNANTGDGDTTTSGSYNLTNGQWYHITVTWDGSYSRFYLNGNLTDTIATGDSSMQNSGEPFEIGAAAKSSDCSIDTESHWNGEIDDVRVWSRKLSDTEIANLYANSCDFDNGLNLQGEWLFDNDSTDAGPNGNDLTSTASSTFQSGNLPYVCSPIISNISAGNITSSATTITWTTSTSSDSTVIYKTSSPATSTPYLTEYDASNVTSHSVSLSGLTSDTTYYYVVVSTDSEGDTSTSTEQSFNTADQPVTFAVKNANSTISSDATLTADEDLSLNLEANKTYIITGAIIASSTSATPDINTQFNVPSGATIAITVGSFNGGAKDAGSGFYSDNTTEIPFDIAESGWNVMHVDGTVTIGGTSGSLDFLWSQNTSDANEVKVFKGSYLRAEEIN